MSAYTSLDHIVKSLLLKKGYPLHFYVRYLVSGRDIIQEMIFDDKLKAPNTILLEVDANGSAPLPCDFVDVAQVGVRAGQLIHPLVQRNSINPLPNRGELGAVEPYPDNIPVSYNYLPNIFWATSYFNDYGETRGRQNAGAGYENDVYKILREQCRIQFSQNFANTTVVLIYLSSGCGCCASMGVHPYARATIEAYMNFDRVRNTRNSSAYDQRLAEQAYLSQRKIFRARMNGLTPDLIQRLIQRSYYIAPKV